MLRLSSCRVLGAMCGRTLYFMHATTATAQSLCFASVVALVAPIRQCSTGHASSADAPIDPAAAAAALEMKNDVGVSNDASVAHQQEQGQPSVKEECDAKLVEILQGAAPATSTEEITALLLAAKSSAEVRKILERLVYRHHLCFDVLNGHGFRVHTLQTLTSIAPRTQCMYEWFDCVQKFRKLGFVLTRTFAAEGFTIIRQWISSTFSLEGRTPHLVTAGTAHIRELILWCQEDRLVFDHVLYARIIFLLTMIVGAFDRQNLYRASFPPSFTKRDGIVVEWVVGSDRCIDFDECVLQCDAVMEEVLELMRRDIPSRPVFSVLYRLIDYYFATDNVEKMVAVMEDSCACGIDVAESSTAKLMQLACALNYPNVPELFMRWRVALPQCVLATPDMSRLMFYYGRSGGGKPCPICGEPYNHRNVNVYCWQRTPPHQRSCPALQMARRQKGELEECRELPQNSDWSARAFQFYELSKARSIEWGAVEWRAFLLCCMFASPEAALKAKRLVDGHLDPTLMDDFLRATYMRLLRHYAPEQVLTTIKHWDELGCRASPISLQEALMGSSMIADSASRLSALQYVWAAVLAKGSYVMPFTRRFFMQRLGELQAGGCPATERDLIVEVIEMKPRHISLLDMKDSASDFVVGTTRKNVYIPSSLLHKVESRRESRPKQSW